MKPGLTVAILCVAALTVAGNVNAEVHVSLRLEHRTTLKFEPVRAFISFFNDSDYAYIVSNKDIARASRFAIEVRRGADGSLVARKSAPIEYLYLMPDEREDIMLDLTEHYAMSAMGRYTITAVTGHHGESFQSKQRLLDIVSGIEVAKAVRSVPNYPGRLRTFSLRKWTRGEGSHLFLAVDETKSGYNYGVYDLGQMIQAVTPKVRADRGGNVTIVHQCAPNCFTRTVFRSTSDEVSLVDQTYHLPNGEPYPSREPPPARVVRRKSDRSWWRFWTWWR